MKRRLCFLVVIALTVATGAASLRAMAKRSQESPFSISKLGHAEPKSTKEESTPVFVGYGRVPGLRTD